MKLHIYRVFFLSIKRFRHRLSLVNSVKLLITLFFKEPFRRLLLHKHLLSHDDLLFFQKRCHAYFPAGNFLGFIYRLRTKVNSVFQTLRQTYIFNPVEICDGALFSKIVNSLNPLSFFAKKITCRCSTRF